MVSTADAAEPLISGETTSGGPWNQALAPRMGKSHKRAGEVVSRVASSLWLLAALLVLQVGAPSLGTAESRLIGSSSLKANIARNERANPRAAQPREQARSVAEARQSSLKPDVPEGADQDALSALGPAPSPGFAAALPSVALADRHVPSIASHAFRARAPPSRA
jgi:hypothetical protein